MDIALARTFIEVMRQGSFVRAAEKLHLTQTAVSARIKSLEEQLDAALFLRHKSGVVLTPAGERFVPYAASLLQVWERARHQVALPAERAGRVVLGCEPSLWDPLLLHWLDWMKRNAGQLGVRAEISASEELPERVLAGTLDVAIVYAPHYRPGLRVEHLIDETLVMVTTDPGGAWPGTADYVHVEWGRDFAEQHSLACPDWPRPAISSDFGPLVLQFLLASGGAGYFRLGAVRAHMEAGRLHRVAEAPEFPYSAYAVHAEDADPTLLEPALQGLRHAASRHLCTPRA